MSEQNLKCYYYVCMYFPICFPYGLVKPMFCRFSNFYYKMFSLSIFYFIFLDGNNTKVTATTYHTPTHNETKAFKTKAVPCN